MERRKLLPLVLLSAVVFCSGCSRQSALIIPDGATSLFYPASIENSSVETLGWMKSLKDGGIRLRFSPVTPDEERWEEGLEREEGDFLIWMPLWSREAFSFHTSRPEIPGILLSPGMVGLPPDGAGNLTVLHPEQQTAWKELAETLQAMDYDRMVGVFSSLTSQREEGSRLLEKVKIRKKTIPGKAGVKTGQKFLEDEVGRGVDFIILAAGGANAELYNVVKNLSIPLFIEAPFPGYQSRGNIEGTFFIPWHEGILTLAALPHGDWPTTSEVRTELNWREDPSLAEEEYWQTNEQ